MIINADFLLPHLREKMRLSTRDGSRHLLCPQCRRRTKLYRLSDSRRKCSICSKKFPARSRAAARSLEQFAALLLCFCLDFTAQRAAAVTGYRYHHVTDVFGGLRCLIARQSTAPTPAKPVMRSSPAQALAHLADCAACRRLTRNGRLPPVFGLKQLRGNITIDPLTLDADPAELPVVYGGFVCHGVFHRFQHARAHRRDQLELFWSLLAERLRSYHGIHAENLGSYLKEFAWKYNNRMLKPQMLAMRLLLLLPPDFLHRSAARPPVRSESRQ